MPANGNRIKVSTASTGTGSIVLGAAENGFQTFNAGGIADGETVRFTIEDGYAWEISEGVYTHGSTSLSRTLTESSTGSLLNLSGNAVVFVTFTSSDIVSPGKTLAYSLIFGFG